jgi:multidrug efflux pump subunit AcrA (membrane-fusion protein)
VRRRALWIGAALLLVLAAAATPGLRELRRVSQIETVEVVEGELTETVEIRGDVEAVRSITLQAPASAGELRIVALAQNGAAVAPGDVVIRFDPTSLKRRLDESRAALREAQAEIDGARAQAQLQEEQDRTLLLKARYDVEKARLEASKQEILAPIEGEKNELRLAEAEQKLKEAEAKAEAHRVAAEAQARAREQKRKREERNAALLERQVAALTVRAPSAGSVNLLPNFMARNAFGGRTPEFRQGDRAWPGASIAELPDLSQVRLRSRIDEADRGRVEVGQTAAVRVDALPDREFAATVATISALAKPDFSSWPVVKSFDLALDLKETDPRLRPGMSAGARVAVDTIRDVLLVPSRACFDKSGRTVVYVKRRLGFEEREIVARRSGSQAAVRGSLRRGDRVATTDPTAGAETEGQP